MKNIDILLLIVAGYLAYTLISKAQANQAAQLQAAQNNANNNANLAYAADATQLFGQIF